MAFENVDFSLKCQDVLQIESIADVLCFFLQDDIVLITFSVFLI